MNRKLDQGELKDRLPDFIHGTLPADERAEVEAAIVADPELARELGAVRASCLALMPRSAQIDTDRIVAAVNRRKPARGLFASANWRIAAIVMLAVGMGSIALVQKSFRTGVGDPSPVTSESAQVASGQKLSISFGYDLSDMPAADFERLVTQLEKSGGVPSVEPRTTTIVPPGDDSQ